MLVEALSGCVGDKSSALASATHMVLISLEISFASAFVEASRFIVAIARTVVVECPLATAHLVVVVASLHSSMATLAIEAEVVILILAIASIITLEVTLVLVHLVIVIVVLLLHG